MTLRDYNELFEQKKRWLAFLDSYKSSGKAFINIEGFSHTYEFKALYPIDNDSPDLIESIITSILANIEKKLNDTN